MKDRKKVKVISRRERKRPVSVGVVRYVDHSISIAKQINIYLKKHEKNQVYLAEKLGKKESEISKWLRGTHNFTLKTISKIEDILDEQIILCPREIEIPVDAIIEDEKGGKIIQFKLETISVPTDAEIKSIPEIQFQDVYAKI